MRNVINNAVKSWCISKQIDYNALIGWINIIDGNTDKGRSVSPEVNGGIYIPISTKNASYRNVGTKRVHLNIL